MRRNWWVGFMMLLVVPGLMLTVSCSSKTTSRGSSTATLGASEQVETDSAAAKRAAEARKKAEEERIKEEKLKQAQLKADEAARQKAAAKNSFVYEDVYFAFDSSDLNENAQALLKRKADWMWNNPGAKVVIEGHCDERGTTDYNIALGERRAKSTKGFLVDLGIAASRLVTVSYGEEKPLDPAHNEEAWAKNRRAHFMLK